MSSFKLSSLRGLTYIRCHSILHKKKKKMDRTCSDRSKRIPQSRVYFSITKNILQTTHRILRFVNVRIVLQKEDICSLIMGQVFKNGARMRKTHLCDFMGPIILLALTAHHTSILTSFNGTSWANKENTLF
jgi:hypothetical protein